MLLAPCSLLQAAPPPELTILRQQYDKVVAERVTAPFDASKAALDAKFSAALANAITTAKQSGKLDDVLAIQDDQKRLTDKIPLPDDTDTTPAALKTLRSIYREQLKKLEDTRTANHATLLPAYTAKLTDLEATLVKNDRIDEAKELRTYRETLVAGAVPATETPMAAAPATPTATTSTPAAASAAKRKLLIVPPEKEREVALAALDLGAPDAVSIDAMHNGKKINNIRKPEDVPSGEIQITRIKIIQEKPPAKRYKDLTPIAGLQHLKGLDLDHFPVQDDDMEVIGTFPSLEGLYAAYPLSTKGVFTGAKLHLIAAPEKLVQFSFPDSPIGSAGVETLGRCVNLTALNISKSHLSDKDMHHLGALTKLTILDLRWTNVTMEGMRHLKPLTSLKTLGWSPDPKQPNGGFSELAAILPQLETLRLRHREGAKDGHYAGIAAFTNLKQVYVKGSNDARMALPGIATVPQMESLQGYWWDGVEDVDLLPLQTHPALSSIDIDSNKKITAKGLVHLSKIPKLKRLVLSRFALLQDADIAEFKRLRPDITVTFNK